MNISDQEKTQLKNKISQSISKYIRRKRFFKYGLGLMAACVVLFFSISIFQKNDQPLNNLDSYVKSLETKEIPEQVKLILNNGQNVTIADTNATISYSKSGEEVAIGDSKSIKQNSVNNQKTVFNTLIVPYGKRSSIALADGSKVWLNSGSKLVFPSSFTKERREVFLEGEAIFEVAHDKERPFIVKSGIQNIEVLGTVFNVSSYQDDEMISTVLKSGSVKIIYDPYASLNSSKELIITPGTLATYQRNDKAIATKRVDIDSYFSWRDGIFIFKNDSMQSIMKKVSRYYNVQIVIADEALANATFSGYLDVNQPVDKVIKTIQETTKFAYTITNDKISIN